MLITITLASPQTDRQKLPPPLAKISHDEYVLIELQGSLNVECADGADRNGQLVGDLMIDEAGVRRIRWPRVATLTDRASRANLL